MAKDKDPRLERAGVSGYNKPKRTPDHPKKSHIVVAKEGDTVKTIRFGEQGAKTAGAPKAGESEAMKKKRASNSNGGSSSVDRRASKGRKIRYTVNPKLVNFTFPVARKEPMISDDVWFKSLFGGVGRS